MTKDQVAENARLRKAGRVPNETLVYLDEIKARRRKITYSFRGWMRYLGCVFVGTLSVTLACSLTINRAGKVCLGTVAFLLSFLLYLNLWARAYRKELDSESPVSAT
jgi:hypothetical protein